MFTARSPLKREVDLSVARPVVEAAAWYGGREARPSILADSNRVAPALCVPPLLCFAHVYLGEMGLAQTPLRGGQTFPDSQGRPEANG